MIYAKDVNVAMGIVKDLNDIDIPCFIDKESALNITVKDSLTDWLDLCPVEGVRHEPIFSIHCTEDLLDGIDDVNEIDHKRLWDLKQEKFELSQKIAKVDHDIKKLTSVE